MMNILQIDSLSFGYAAGKENVLSDISFTVGRGEYIVICGRSGSGKTTLLRHLKPAVAPVGSRTGRILFNDEDLNDIDLRTQSRKIGFVMQNTDNQIVTDKVWHELSFGLENLGFDSDTIRRKVAEMSDYFGISDWFNKDVCSLSGGQKQLLNLAAVMAMDPEVLILDEPVSQLDPLAASDFLNTVNKLNKELGVTVIITEHRLEEIFAHADRIIVLEKGRILSDASPSETGKKLGESLDFIRYAMPSPMRIYAGIGKQTYDCPVTVRDGRKWLEKEIPSARFTRICRDDPPASETAAEIRNLFFGYDKKDRLIIDSLSVSFKKGKITAILGGNGAGKSTLLKLIAGIYKPISGKIKKKDRKTAYLPQNVQSVFCEKTVKDDLFAVNRNNDDIERIIKLMNISDILDSHPFDLSGGEMQRAATAKAMLTDPDFLLLDEPTKGMDGEFKISFAKMLKEFAASGRTVIIVSHDIEFCASYADVCMMLFNGKIVSSMASGDFFAGNTFYTTAAHRMSKGIFKNAVTDGEVVYLCKKNLML